MPYRNHKIPSIDGDVLDHYRRIAAAERRAAKRTMLLHAMRAIRPLLARGGRMLAVAIAGTQLMHRMGVGGLRK